MEKIKTKPSLDEKGSYCIGGQCAHGTCHSHFVLLRWVLGMIILGMVFCMGFMFGEIKGEFASGWNTGFGGYGNGGMMQNFGSRHLNGGNGMLRGQETYVPAPAPATNTTTTQK